MGHAVRLEDGRIRVSKDFVAKLERTEVTRVGKAMAGRHARGWTFTAARRRICSGPCRHPARKRPLARSMTAIGFQCPWATRARPANRPA